MAQRAKERWEYHDMMRGLGVPREEAPRLPYVKKLYLLPGSKDMRVPLEEY